MRADLESLVIENIPLAKMIAGSIYSSAKRTASGSHLEFEDIQSMAFDGLVEAVSKWEGYCERNNYDPEAREFFQYYARRRINGAIYDEFRNRDWASRTLRSSLKKIWKANPNGDLSNSEVASLVGMSEDAVREAIVKGSMQPLSLDVLVEDISDGDFQGEADFNNRIGDSSDVFFSEVEQLAEASALLGILVVCFQELPPEQQVVLALRYFNNLDLKEVAQLVEATEARVSNLHTKAVLAISSALCSAAAK